MACRGKRGERVQKQRSGTFEQEAAAIEAEEEAIRAEEEAIDRQLNHLKPPDKKPPVVLDNGKFRTVKVKPIKAITASELDKMDIPPITWLVKDILPVGLSMIGAPSKYYKSYMALGLCLAICEGGKFLGFDCEKHACLYFDLESTKRRPKNRINQIAGLFTEKPDNLYIITGEQNPGRIGEGFEEQVELQLSEHPNIKLIVVDVFQMIRQPKKRNQTDYDCDYENFKAIKQITDAHDIGLTLIHHTRKMKDPTDVFNELSGSVGVMGALDCAWVISKDDRYATEATLHITGRDLEPRKLKVRFNKKTFQWEYIGTEEDVENQRFMAEYEQSPVVETIKKLVKQGNGRWEGSAGDIVEASKYLTGCTIYDDSRKVGNLIDRYGNFLEGVDNIVYERKRTGKSGKRVYVFHVSHDSDVSDVSDVSQIEIKDITDIG